MNAPLPAQFPFGRDFQIGVLALMSTRYDFLCTAVELFEPHYFEDKILVWFFQTMKAYFQQYQEHPVINPVLENELKKAASAGQIKASDLADYQTVLAEMKKPVQSQAYVIDELIKFCRRMYMQKEVLAHLHLFPTADSAMWDEIVEKFGHVRTIGLNYLDLGTNYFRTAQNRIVQRQHGDQRKIVPVGINGFDTETGALMSFDYLIGGGLKDGQLGCWLGGTGRGKSVALCHVGKLAVTLGYKVAHYTLELDETEVAERYDATWTQTPINQLVVAGVSVSTKMRDLEWRYGDQLMIKAYPTGSASINTIKAHLRQLEGLSWVPDLIVIDYGDLLKPLTNYQDAYDDLGAIFSDLRGMAGERRVPVWTATQANRAGLNAEVVDVDHIGDSLRKAQIVDILIALCARQDEIKQNVMRLYLAKNRNGPDKAQVGIIQTYATMTFVDVLRTAEHAQALQQGGGTSAGAAAAPPGMPQPTTSRRGGRPSA